MKITRQAILLCFAIFCLLNLPVQANNLDQALLLALSSDTETATAATQELRSQGLAGVNSLLAAAPDLGTEERQPWERVLDTVCAQRDCANSGLFWHTDFDHAQAEAERTGRPILSLRLLGRLDEEVSCANSRFFRTVLYPDPDIANVLRKRFVLHWESVRPVPRITIDYGDGRSLQGTITGNSIHYILDAKGRLVDALPGLYGPGLFLKQLTAAEQLAQQTAQLHNVEYLQALTTWHTMALVNREQGFAKMGGMNSLLASAPASSSIAPTALEAARLAMSKSSVELPLVNAVSLNGEEAPEDPFDWAKLAKHHRAGWKLSAASRKMLMAKHQPANDAVARNTFASFETALGLDTVRNEYQLHSILHYWLARPRGTAPDLTVFNERVYADLFLTPSSDPWLGLRSADTYLALAPSSGVSK